MGGSGTVRDKHIRPNRKNRSQKSDSCCKSCKHHVNVSVVEYDININPNPTLNPNIGSYPDHQLEHFLLNSVGTIYNDALNKLVALHYDEGLALKAILRTGHCFGGMHALTNILSNALSYLSKNRGDSESESESEGVGFSDLRQLAEYSLASMVSSLRQVRPNLSKRDAMRCLFAADFNVGKATTIEIPVSEENGIETAGGGGDGVIVDNPFGLMMPPPLCTFHEGWGFGNAGPSDLKLQKDIELPKGVNLTPEMQSLLKSNVARFAAGLKAAPDSGTASDLDSPAVKSFGDSHNLDSADAVNSMLSKFRELSIEGKLNLVPEDKKDEMILTLFRQIMDLHKQVQERKEWAHEKAVQAARKLTSDLNEMKTLRMEREETQRLKKGKESLEDSTTQRLSEMESALRKASGEVDQANAAVKKLETENAEIKAELEAAKLSASESITACLKVANREKKCLKKLLSSEKQNAKLQQAISDEKQKILEIQEELAHIKQCEKEAEVKMGEELKAKEEALALVEVERRSKEAADANNRRNLKALRLKIEIDIQRRKDDLLRLEQELACLKVSAQSADLRRKSNTSLTSESEGAKLQREKIAQLFQELYNIEGLSDKEVSGDRECILCKKDQVSIVFLPCAHQVMCAGCSEVYGRKSKAVCPCCHVPIEKRICVFGVSS
ncbi:hypothetical protein RIF29_36900 [Crotalaria pallida]|uniref:RING-type domain-containing protein n=1 Tax=Crotalaria pallida TaxID=3830 RepID=A0AAN9EBM8_CROPI